MRNHLTVCVLGIVAAMSASVANAGMVDRIVPGRGLKGIYTHGPVVTLHVGAGPGVSVARNAVGLKAAGTSCEIGSFVTGFDANGNIVCSTVVTNNVTLYNTADGDVITNGAWAYLPEGRYAIRHAGGTFGSSGHNEVIVWSVDLGDALTLNANSSIIISKSPGDDYLYFYVPDNDKSDNTGSWTVTITELDTYEEQVVTILNTPSGHAVDMNDGGYAGGLPPGTYVIDCAGEAPGAFGKVLVWSASTEVVTLHSGSSVTITKPTGDPFLFWIPDDSTWNNSGSLDITVRRIP